MAEALEATDEVEFDGDPDLLIASRDFEKVADARINVSAQNSARFSNGSLSRYAHARLVLLYLTKKACFHYRLDIWKAWRLGNSMA